MRNKFSLSHKKLFSCDMGELIPCGMYEVLPGDTVQQATSALVRCAPMLAPVMHPVNTRIHHWFVPYRLLWEEFEEFITGGPDGMDDTTYPTITLPAGGGVTVGTLADYMGIPLGVASLNVSALPFRAYAFIWNEWYRDQDLQTELVWSDASGADTTTNTTLQNVAWEKDYFTAARPWEQKGPAITIPLGTQAPVSGLGLSTNVPFSDANQTVKDAKSGLAGVVYPNSIGSVATTFRMRGTLASASGVPDVYADLTGASAITITALREAMALQRYEEARARYGSRYVEYLRYLGVKSSDARLQRPEYLGGGSQTLQFSEVLQTAEGENPVGEMAGHGIGGMRSNRWRRFFEEHGIVMSFMSTKPKTIYTQGLARMWNRRVKEDFWQKEFEHIGQQEIKNKELYAAHASPEGTFGYADRYAEYRSEESTVSGEFRTTELSFWHFARQFASDPALNATFVKSVPTEIPFAVPSRDVLYVMANHSVQARRLVSASAKSFIY